jgi:hypothetical protein
VFDEHVGHVLFAEFEVEGEGPVVVPGEETHAGGFDRSDDESSLCGCNLPESGRAGFLDLGVGRKIFEGEDVVGRETEDGFGGEGSGEFAGAEDGGVEGFGGLVVGYNDETRGISSTDEERKIEGAGGEGEARDTSAPRATA